MEIISITLMLLATVVVSSAIARGSASIIPLPFAQIALGGLLAATFDLRIEIDPEVFLLLFIAPLLFLDGWRIPKEGLFGDKWTISALALGLVLFTVVGAGFFIHWLIPAVPMPAAFALAAVLSPTDAVAISAITARSPLPRRLMHILEGESLLNDATGLVCMRLAIASVVTGAFSIVDATGTFVWLALGGLAIGATVALAANAAKDWGAKRFGEDSGTQILVSLLIPFGAYALATLLEASGILAAVAAGVAMNFEESTGRASALTRIRRAAVWDAIQFAGNGVIFVVLGYQLPNIVSAAEKAVSQSGHSAKWWLLGYVVAIYLVLLSLRALWVWTTFRLARYRAQRAQAAARPLGWRLILATSLAGVRGALTLSGVMALPFVLEDGSPFPARDLSIYLAAGIILLSLVSAHIVLPFLTRKEVGRGLRGLGDRREEELRLTASQKAIEAVDRIVGSMTGQPDADLYIQAGQHVVERYRQRVDWEKASGQDVERTEKSRDIQHQLRLIALSAEREEFYRAARSGQVSDELSRRLVRGIDLLEARLSAA